MADVWLIVVSSIAAVLLLGMSFVFLVYYSHPDDKNTAWFPKLIVILSFTMSEMMVLFVVLDVANQGGNPLCGKLTSYNYVAPVRRTFAPTIPFNSSNFNASAPSFAPTPLSVTVPNVTLPDEFTYAPPCGTLAIGLMWTAMWFVVAIFVGLLIPFNIFFYEANEAGRKMQSRICEAIQYQGVALVLTGLTLGLMYWQINSFTYPLAVVINDPTRNPVTLCDASEPFCLEVPTRNGPAIVFDPNSTEVTISSSSMATSDLELSINSVPNSFGVYLASFMSFIGWWLFCMYTGVGLITLPIDLVKAYRFRPKYIPKDVYIKLREELRQRVVALQAMGEQMKKDRKNLDEGYNNLGYRERYSKGNKQRTMFLEFKKEVTQVEIDYEDLYQCHEAWSSYNPLIPYVKLVLGVISGILSLCWILQIILYILPQYWPTGASYIPTFFLNDFLTWGLIYSGFSIIGVVFVAIFGLYLLACNANGNFKIGLRFLVMEIHPMKVGGTYMSSFLVNVLLLLLQTPALINFLALSFSNTIVLTDIDLIMNWSVRFTTFFIYFFDNNVFIFLLLAFSVLAICLVYALPDETKRSTKRLKNRINRMQERLEEKEKVSNKKTRGLGLKDIVERAKEKDAEAEEDDAGGGGDTVPKTNAVAGT